MSLIRRILGMKDLSAEFEIPEVSINKKSIPKEKKSGNPPPPPPPPVATKIPKYDGPPIPFSKSELDWIKKLSTARKTISRNDLVSQIKKAKFKEITNNRVLELLDYVYKKDL